MNKENIPKGKVILKTNVHPNTDGTKWGWVGLDKIRQADKIPGLHLTWEEGRKSEDIAEFIAEAFNVLSDTNMTPNELQNDRNSHAIALKLRKEEVQKLQIKLDDAEIEIKQLQKERDGLRNHLQDALTGLEWRIENQPTQCDKSDYDKVIEWKNALNKTK